MRALLPALIAAALGSLGCTGDPSLRDELERRIAATLAFEENGRADRIGDDLATLEGLEQGVRELERRSAEDSGLGARLRRISLATLRTRAVEASVHGVERILLEPVRFALEKRLTELGHNDVARRQLALQTYLMLGDGAHLDPWFAARQCAAIWAEGVRPSGGPTLQELRGRVRAILSTHFSRVAGSTSDAAAVRSRTLRINTTVAADARAALASVSLHDRLYARLVDALDLEVRDPDSAATRANLMFPPVTLDGVFEDRREVLGWLRSARGERGDGTFAVPGAYTREGRREVRARLANAASRLADEAWFLPLEDTERGSALATEVQTVARTYDQRYARAWRAFLEDLRVSPPRTLEDAERLLGAGPGGLAQAEWPYRRVLSVLQAHEPWGEGEPPSMAGMQDAVARYVSHLEPLHGAIVHALAARRDAPVGAVYDPMERARARTRDILAALDPSAQRLLAPLLLDPLHLGARRPTTNTTR